MMFVLLWVPFVLFRLNKSGCWTGPKVIGRSTGHWSESQKRGLCGSSASVGTVEVTFVGLITSNSTHAASRAWQLQLRLGQVLVHAVILLCKLK